jgi:hypothetical protein
VTVQARRRDPLWISWFFANAGHLRFQVVTQVGKKCALSAPENTGRRGLYKTVHVGRRGSGRGRPLLGRAAFRPFQNQIESLPVFSAVQLAEHNIARRLRKGV